MKLIKNDSLFFTNSHPDDLHKWLLQKLVADRHWPLKLVADRHWPLKLVGDRPMDQTTSLD